LLYDEGQIVSAAVVVSDVVVECLVVFVGGDDRLGR